jgi:ribonuclease III
MTKKHQVKNDQVKNDQVEWALNYKFHDQKLLQEALIAAGAGAVSPVNARKHGNKGLALIGDAILRLVLVDDGVLTGKSTGEPFQKKHICLDWRFPTNNVIAKCEGICSAEASNAHLFLVERKIGLDPFIQLPHSLKSVTKTTGASTLEALVGAVWLDSGRDFGQVHRVVHDLHIGAKQACSDSITDLSLESLTIF